MYSWPHEFLSAIYGKSYIVDFPSNEDAFCQRFRTADFVLRFSFFVGKSAVLVVLAISATATDFEKGGMCSRANRIRHRPNATFTNGHIFLRLVLLRAAAAIWQTDGIGKVHLEKALTNDGKKGADRMEGNWANRAAIVTDSLFGPTEKFFVANRLRVKVWFVYLAVTLQPQIMIAYIYHQAQDRERLLCTQNRSDI